MMVLSAWAAWGDVAPRLDVGAAALEADTGKLLWEAWEPDDLPAGTAPDVRQAAMKLLSSTPEQPSPRQEGEVRLPSPIRLGADREVRMELHRDRTTITLHERRDDQAGREIARAILPSTDGEPAGLFGELLVLKTRKNTLHAFAAHSAKDLWKPEWTFDILLKPPTGQGARLFYHPARLAVHDGLLWLATGDRLTALDQQGRTRFDLAFEPHLPPGWEAPPPQIIFQKDRLYCVHSSALVAVDRTTQKELWRHYTRRGPFLSRMADTPPLVLVQIGSDCPRTITNTLTESTYAGPRLGEITPARVAAAAAFLRAYGDGYPRRYVRQVIQKYKASAEAEKLKAAASMERTLPDWPARRDRTRLALACVTALRDAAAPRPGAQPSPERAMTWALLQEMVFASAPNAYGDAPVAFTEWHNRPLALPPGSLQELRDLCRSAVKNGHPIEQPFAASLLLSDEVAGNHVSQGEIEQLLLRPEGGVWRWAATRLARDGKRVRLLELARKRSPEDRLATLWIISPRLPEVMSSEEEDFWMDCVQADALKTAYWIRLAWFTRRDVPARFRGPIAAALEREVASPTVLINSQAQYDMEAGLDLLDRWGGDENIQLLRKYLRHPCHSDGGTDPSGYTQRKVKVYTTRQRVADMLKRRGETVPSDVVFREVEG